MAAGGFAALTGNQRIKDAGNKWPLISSYFLILAVLGWHNRSMQSKRARFNAMRQNEQGKRSRSW